ncbi:aspartate/glutamate racemase family protein [Risungbinella massiliensis]|uniref:aspartate/glutamate racemase family protein n=1 Tax=Risungbinella massiliensis TaxID=1329796 RepID=UPI0005CB94F5|nr:aspartate/glutamate racemase family protein [Risungbinella massiliensis]
MKVIGLLGGMSWESSAIYYELINKRVKEKLGGHHSAQIIMYSVDFQKIKDYQHNGEWNKATNELISAAQRIEKAGADYLVICTNTMHKSADEIQENIKIPLLHIADTTAEQIKNDNIHNVGLLATNFTMEENFYKGRLRDKYGLNVLIPNHEDRTEVHNIIYNELCLGEVRSKSKESYKRIIDKLIQDGAEAIILGCTEITMLIGQDDVSIPVYDTTAIHARTAADQSIAIHDSTGYNLSSSHKL